MHYTGDIPEWLRNILIWGVIVLWIFCWLVYTWRDNKDRLTDKVDKALASNSAVKLAYLAFVFSLGIGAFLTYDLVTEESRHAAFVESMVRDPNISFAECAETVCEFWNGYKKGPRLYVSTMKNFLDEANPQECKGMIGVVRKHLRENPTAKPVVFITGDFTDSGGDLISPAWCAICLDVGRLYHLFGNRFKSIERIYAHRWYKDSEGSQVDVVLCFTNPSETAIAVANDRYGISEMKGSAAAPVVLYDTASGMTIRYHSVRRNRY
jgi:hypothetical protein